MQGYILEIAYKGTNYCGWQVQPDKPTVQSTLQSACASVLGEEILLTGCSRTDSGVHAKGFIATVCGEVIPNIPEAALPLAINTNLPEDISVISARTMPEGFHPRYDAKGKEYIYTVRNSRIKDPFSADTAWHYARAIDVDKANELCNQFVGKQDFRAFMAAGSKIIDTVREVKYFNVRAEDENVIFTVAADGFLYNMVRIMVGTVVERASGINGMDIPDIIESQNRSNAGITAPAHGLTLNRVFY